MARNTAPKGKVVRRFGTNLFGNPKFDRLLAKRSNPPGQHGAMKTRKKVSEYCQQLAEKQKLKFIYGLHERQFRSYYQRALKQDGVTGDNLMVLLETRLDNVVYRLGFAPTREASRQLILHGHVKVNHRRVNVPSFALRGGDEITLKDSGRSQALVRRHLEVTTSRDVPEWLLTHKEQLRGQIVRKPLGSEIPRVANEQLVVELYSK
jgi:small subunit ribosomal protein S4